ncbi:MAG: GatB/YqeY domain-containing protein [bacterium]|nr:GatB/YqeY domain-containing protein [bacterium]
MLHTQIKNDIKEAMKNKEVVRLSVLRNIVATCTNELVATGKTPQDTLDDTATLAVIKRLSKQRIDSIKQFEDGERFDLVASEKEELAILTDFLPQTMSRDEIRRQAEETIKELGITEARDSGKAIGVIMKKLGGAADGADVKAVLEELLRT